MLVLKYGLSIIGLIVGLIVYPLVTNAETDAKYSTNGQAAFYGTYEPPEEPDDSNLIVSPGFISRPTDTQISSIGKQQTNSTGAGILPATGSYNEAPIQIFGSLLLISSSFIVTNYLQKRRDNYEKIHNFYK